ncbi:MAG: argininosuccinate lyase, partial [Bacillota bacterium]|nr:argininosuccinate lyase [Bacillota bacterium]
YPLDREMTAAWLGFAKVMPNAMDAVSDRDLLLETTGVLALLMVHLSRFAEEIILWSSQEFAFVELDDAYATGSSIMPQKKNPDIAELARGLAARVLSDQQRLFVLLKGLPLAYNKDLQEDKEALFDAVDSVLLVLPPFTGMLETMVWRTRRMRQAAGRGFTNATDFADYLVGRGIAFRDAHRIVGELVRLAGEKGLSLEELPLETLQAADSRIAEDIYAYIGLEACVERRSAATGGPAPAAVLADIERLEARLGELLG